MWWWPRTVKKPSHFWEDTSDARATTWRPLWRPHLIVLDVNLPKHNGDAVLRHVRRQPWLKGVPVIMLTSSASPADRAAAIDLGANLYLQKSSDLDELLEVGKIVEAVLARSLPDAFLTAETLLTRVPPDKLLQRSSAPRRTISCCNR